MEATWVSPQEFLPRFGEIVLVYIKTGNHPYLRDDYYTTAWQQVSERTQKPIWISTDGNWAPWIAPDFWAYIPKAPISI